MSDLFEDDAPAGSNAPELSVSEVAGAVKRVIEGAFGQVRVRGEVGRVVLARTGHLYFDLKDDRAVLAAITWKGQAPRLRVQPEEGMEVVATGRLTTFPGQSKYQMIVDDIAPAGVGALMAMLEKRKAALGAEGLFAEARKKPLPYLPKVIGVVTSPTGAVIRDILHRLRERFARHVLIWPVAVQGANCATEVAAAIRGFNALPEHGEIPRPDLLIVARGGGSIEDLWGFNEEIVVRAAAESRIPLISAVGHETDTTLIDYAADRRAPTPTAAAEIAVPVRLELLAAVDGLGARLSRAAALAVGLRQQRLRDLARALPRPESLVAQAQQRFDVWSGRLPSALRDAAGRKRQRFGATAALIRPELLGRLLTQERRAFVGLAGRLRSEALRVETGRKREALAQLGARLQAVARGQVEGWRQRLESYERLRLTLGYEETLRRGYAVVRGDGAVVTSIAAAKAAVVLEIQFQDGRLLPGRAPRRKDTGPAKDQPSLL